MRKLTCILVLLLAESHVQAADPGTPRESAGANQWVKVNEGKTGERSGSTLVTIPERKQMLLIGPAKDASYVQTFDPADRAWSDFSAVAPSFDQGTEPRSK